MNGSGRHRHDDDPALDRPLFLVGAPRSGTSAVYKALCLHPDVAWISNWVRRYPAVPQLAALNRLAGLAPRARVAAWFDGGDNAYVYGDRRPWWRRAFPMPVEGEPLYARCGASPDTATGGRPVDTATAGRPVDTATAGGGDEQVAALRASFAAIRRYGGGRTVVSKRIANNRRIPLLLAAFPGARFVELVRDGRAVAFSLSRVDWWPDDVVWWYGDTPRRWEAQGGDPWELCARSWVEELRAVEEGLRAVPEHQVLSVRYERFVSAPLDVLGAIAGFGGLPSLPQWRRRLAELRFPDRNEAWRRQLGREEIGTIERIQGDALRTRGYVA